MTWAEEELSRVDLGDTRRNKRLVKIVEDLAAKPHESVPQASRDNAAMQATYEFWANRRIKASSILSAHTTATIERIKQHQVVLAVSESGVPLGLLEEKTWAREKARKGKGETERKRKIEEKESYRWLKSQALSQNLIPPEISVITIADREADIYELFAQPRRERSDLLIRAAQNRRIKKAERERGKLFETLRSVEPCGEKTLELQRTPRRKARWAKLTT